MDMAHIKNTNLEQIKKFFFSHYAPNNAILALTGNIEYELAYKLAQKWFGPIEKRTVQSRNLPPEPEQNEERIMTIESDVPATALYKVWHLGARNSNDFYTLDLITDLLSGGESGRLYTKLVREKKLFSEINAYLTAEIDPGLIIINGKLMKGVDIHYANDSVNEVINSLLNKKGIEDEMEKVKNKFESSTVFSNTSILNKAANLSFFELLGNPGLINNEVDAYRKVSYSMVTEAIRKYFIPSNCSTINYISTRKEK
jgi:predicted Zn-dependent peptidase